MEAYMKLEGDDLMKKIKGKRDKTVIKLAAELMKNDKNLKHYEAMEMAKKELKDK